MDDLYLISSPSDVHCNHCDALNRNVDIFDDIRTGDWAYLFECRACERINDEHGNNLDRGSAEILFVLYITALAFVVWGALGRAWWVISLGVAIFAFTLISARVAASGRNRS